MLFSCCFLHLVCMDCFALSGVARTRRQVTPPTDRVAGAKVAWYLKVILDVDERGAMPILTIKHVTTYRYRQPVAFGEHRMMLRPRDSHDQSLIDARLLITPTPTSLRFVRDAFDNHVDIARFAGRA